MDDVILIGSDESENSIVEVEVPRKPTPPLIFIEDEEMILNIMEDPQKCILAKDFIHEDKSLAVLPGVSGTSSHINTPNHWTADMIKFYDDDWGDEEHFVVEKLQEKMDKSPALWKISIHDKMLTKKHRKNKTKCRLCSEFGHHGVDCPKKVPKCHMCGTEGHVEYTCPNAKCLNCGNQTKEFLIICNKCRNEERTKCSRCQIFGHHFINCSDHWRLYHLTTGTTSVTVPLKNPYKSYSEIWCCNCGRRGHHYFQCNGRRDFNVFLDGLPFVSSYQKAFGDNFPSETIIGVPKKRCRKHPKYPKQEGSALVFNPMHKTIARDKMFINNNHNRHKRTRRRGRKKKLRHSGMLQLN